jgi:hypothetical protein
MLKGNNKPLKSSLNISTNPNTTNSNTTNTNTTSTNTTSPNTTRPNTSTTIPTPTTTKANTVELTNSHTNLFQRDFNGSSNIYSPYIYY